MRCGLGSLPLPGRVWPLGLGIQVAPLKSLKIATALTPLTPNFKISCALASGADLLGEYCS